VTPIHKVDAVAIKVHAVLKQKFNALMVQNN
jgi:hypothetical protein